VANYFVLTKYRAVHNIGRMPALRLAQGRPERSRGAVSNRDVRLVQVAYPQIYFACHTRHLRRASSATQLSPADSTLLAHLEQLTPRERKNALGGLALLGRAARESEVKRS
jgi:hypothetical protein